MLSERPVGQKAWRPVLRIIFWYVGVAVLLDLTWDLLVGRLFNDAYASEMVHLAQEWLIFGFATAVFVVFIRRELLRREKAEESLAQAVAALEGARQGLEDRVAERTRQLATLLDISGKLASTLELEPLFGLILEQLKIIVDYTGATIFVQEDSVLKVVEYRGPVPAEDVRAFEVCLDDAPIYRQILQVRAPIIIDDIEGDTPLAQLLRAQIKPDLRRTLGNCRAWMGVPLISRERVIGVLRFDHVEPGFFTPLHAQLALNVANQAATAMENARLYARAQKVAALEERQRLARELHDSISQAFYGIVLGAQTAQELLRRDARQSEASQTEARQTEACQAAEEPLEYIATMAEVGLTEMRSLIFELRPETLEKEGLLAALSSHATLLRARYKTAIAFDGCIEPEAPVEVKETLLRVAQEALYNAAKHSRASEVSLRVGQDNEGITLEVSDNGVGFDPQGDFPGHFGLKSMSERAARAGGRLAVKSRPGAGTRVVVTVPMRTRQVQEPGLPTAVAA